MYRFCRFCAVQAREAMTIDGCFTALYIQYVIYNIFSLAAYVILMGGESVESICAYRIMVTLTICLLMFYQEAPMHCPKCSRHYVFF